MAEKESTFMDDVECGNFFDQIDDLLQFPPENECINNNGLLDSDECKEFPSIWNEDNNNNNTKDVNYSLFPISNFNPVSDLSAELSIPYDDDIIHLEWLSAFVEDSFSGGGMTLAKDTTSFINKGKSQNAFYDSSPISVLESSSCSSNSNNSNSGSNSFNSSGMKIINPIVPNHHRTAQRARSKRPRPATFSPRSMSIQLMSSTSASLESESKNEMKNKMKKMKPKINPPLGTTQNNIAATTTTQAAVRKCLHCEITKTPQWRAGPLGPKTLCNACGVRYKSGRLFPEYRPAASPTFVPSVHSNSHKKVIEMRNNLAE